MSPASARGSARLVADGPSGASAATPAERHIVLVGLPGAGKTTVGRAVADLLDRPFIDFDAEIVRREGRPVTAIFAEEGEAYFRAREAELTREVVERRGWVIAPGGGWLLQPELVTLMRPVSVTVHLRVRPETAAVRLGAGASDRPLLGADDPLPRLHRLWAERRERYAAADVEVDTEAVAVEDVARMVIDLTARTVPRLLSLRRIPASEN